MKSSRIIIASVLVTLLLSTSAMAWNGGRNSTCRPEHPGIQHENRLEFMSIALDLNAEQKQQIADLSSVHRAHRIQLRQDLDSARQDLRSIQPGVNFDAAALKAKAEKFAQLKTAMLVDRVQHRQQIFSLLTPEQQEKAAKLQAINKKHGKDKGAGRHPHFKSHGHQLMIDTCR